LKLLHGQILALYIVLIATCFINTPPAAFSITSIPKLGVQSWCWRVEMMTVVVWATMFLVVGSGSEEGDNSGGWDWSMRQYEWGV